MPSRFGYFPFAILLITTLGTSPANFAQSQESPTYDVVIYGGTSAAMAAAVQCKILNKSVIVVSPDTHLGGLTSGGLGWTDSGRKEVIGGISRKFYQDVQEKYRQPSAWRQQRPEQYSRFKPSEDAMWVFEPHVAESVYEEWVKKYNIPVDRDQWLDRENGVVMKDGKIISITMLSGKKYTGKIFFDTTYEGDLMAAAGVSYHVGRESNATYGETLNGVQKANATKHQIDRPVSAYKIPGDPSSGLVALVHGDEPGEDGEGDQRIQAYCYRMCLTTDPSNRVEFPKPSGYDPDQYVLLARFLNAGWREIFNKFDPIPNLKTDTNNHGGFSSDNIGMNYDYPEASYERRREIMDQHTTYQQGWLYFMANDPSVPQDVRDAVGKWGLAADEFVETNNWPHQIYVREARRMVSDFVMAEPHLRGIKETPDSIGMGSYNMDSHNVQRYVDKDGNAKNEGDVQVSPGGPYPISYRAITPKVDECRNLLVPVCLSSSHIAYGSIRMEPVFMVLGHSAATAAAMAIDQDIDVQAIDYKILKEKLLAEGQVLTFDRAARPVAANIKDLPGIVQDDTAAVFVGEWGSGGAIQPALGGSYRHILPGDVDQTPTATFNVTLKPGRYEVRIAYTAHANRSSRVPVSVQHRQGTETKQIDQRKPSENAPWITVGIFDFGDSSTVTVTAADSQNYTVVDGIQFIPVSTK